MEIRLSNMDSSIHCVNFHSFSYKKGFSDICDYTGVKSSPWIFPFFICNIIKMLFFFPLILIFSNAPFIDKKISSMYLSEQAEINGALVKCFYIVVASALYFAFVMVFSIVLNLDCIEFTGEWGKLLNTLANTTMGTKFQLGFSPERNVINMFSPISAMWFTFLHSWISGVILGFVIFLFNMKIKGSGTFLASFLLVFSAVAAKQTSLVKKCLRCLGVP